MRHFLCDLAHCKGECCVEGDAGAPLEEEEFHKLREILPEIWNDLSPKAQEVINKQGVGYIDEDGDIVTSIVDGKDCVFTCYDAEWHLQMRHREGLPRGKNRLLQAHLLPSLPDPDYEIPGIPGSQLSSLESM